MNEAIPGRFPPSARPSAPPASMPPAAPVSIVDVRLRLLEMVLEHRKDRLNGLLIGGVVKEAQALEEYVRSPVEVRPPQEPPPHPTR